jgi:hypothetical protein
MALKHTHPTRGHVGMMNKIISNLIVFEIFASEHEYMRFCVDRVLMWFTGSKLESVRYPCSTSLSVRKILNIRHLLRP